MRNPSEEGGSLICYVGQVWKLPMRNPSVNALAAVPTLNLGLEATYEESKQPSRKGQNPELFRFGSYL